MYPKIPIIYLSLLAVSSLSLTKPGEVAAQPAPVQTTPADQGSGVGEADPLTNDAQDRVLELDTFRVTATEGTGYVVKNTTAGLRTNQPINKIPQAITVLTRDFIDDVGQTGSSDVLRFAGVGNFFQGESVAMRGGRVANPSVEGFGSNEPYMDNLNVDSYEVMRGPGSAGAVSGTINRVTKRPTENRTQSITLKVDQNGMFRQEIDSSGPVYSSDHGRLSYRFLLGHQDGGAYFRFKEDERLLIFPTLQYDFNNGDTTMLVEFEQTNITHAPNANNFLTPEGELFIGAGRKEGYFAPGGMEDFDKTGGRFSLYHTFSPNVNMKFAASGSRFTRFGYALLAVGGVNYRDRTVGFFSRQNSQDFESYSGEFDINVLYKLGPLNNTTTFGLSSGQGSVQSRFWVSSLNFMERRSIDDPQMETWEMPTSVPQPANAGTLAKTFSTSVRLQQIWGLFDDRLTVVGNLDYTGTDATTRTNIGDPQAPVTNSRNYFWPWRAAAAFAINEYVSVYANTSEIEAVNTTARDINGDLLPGPTNVGEEVGVKFYLLGGRVTSTFAMFRIATENQAVFAGVNADGVSYFSNTAETEQTGWDWDVSASINDKWQVVATYFKGDNETPNGGRIANSYRGSWSLVTRYEFKEGRLKGLAIGAGASKITDRIVSPGGIVFPVGQTAPAFLTLDSEVLANIFASYRYKNWTVRARVDNLLDKAFPLGAQNAWIVDPSLPRTASLSIDYTF